MASLIDLRRRIRSVKNTQQITAAMKMVSAAKLRRAQDAVLSARPYAQLLREMIESIRAHSAEDSPVRSHPLMASREENNVLVVLLTGDRGLCGAFNSNSIKASQRFLAEHAAEHLELELLGRKGVDYYRKREARVAGEWPNIFRTIEYGTAQKIAARIMERFEREEIDGVYMIYNTFKSVMRQDVVVDHLLPVKAGQDEKGGVVDYIYEQPPERIFEGLLPRYVEVRVYQALLESGAAEHAARMTAMEAATKNADEMLDNLTLTLNRVRQASITTELIEIVAGAQALE